MCIVSPSQAVQRTVAEWQWQPLSQAEEEEKNHDNALLQNKPLSAMEKYWKRRNRKSVRRKGNPEDSEETNEISSTVENPESTAQRNNEQQKMT